ncbi:hypothetical protein LUD21_28085, partial [Klebsiella pneumoniae]|nr:hypothetical protein [Klebsiella pneumoniae]
EAAICRGQMVGQLRVGMVPLASLNPMQLIKPLAEQYPALQFSRLSTAVTSILIGIILQYAGTPGVISFIVVSMLMVLLSVGI